MAEACKVVLLNMRVIMAILRDIASIRISRYQYVTMRSIRGFGKKKLQTFTALCHCCRLLLTKLCKKIRIFFLQFSSEIVKNGRLKFNQKAFSFKFLTAQGLFINRQSFFNVSNVYLVLSILQVFTSKRPKPESEPTISVL